MGGGRKDSEVVRFVFNTLHEEKSYPRYSSKLLRLFVSPVRNKIKKGSIVRLNTASAYFSK